jgi:hypothetical protein
VFEKLNSTSSYILFLLLFSSSINNNTWFVEPWFTMNTESFLDLLPLYLGTQKLSNELESWARQLFRLRVRNLCFFKLFIFLSMVRVLVTDWSGSGFSHTPKKLIIF